MYIKADEKGIKTVPASKSWRLFHNGVEAFKLEEQDFAVECGGATEVFVAKTEKECKVEADKLGLFFRPVEETEKVG